MELSPIDTDAARAILRDALSLWWLRPENALALASYCMRGTSLRPVPGQVAADFACGDGVNTFFKCGGRFDSAFDIFSGAVNTADVRAAARGDVDVFDFVAEDYAPVVTTRPDGRYAYGTDHKRNLLTKAERLGFYDQTLLADLTGDSGIPDESLDIAYCNSLYWVDDPAAAFGHIANKVRPGGRLVFDVMTEQREELNFAGLFPQMPEHWSVLMNRGRQNNNPGLRGEKGWDELFGSSGFAEVNEKRDIFPTAIAQIWNVGLRPLFPILNKLVEAVDPKTRLGLKLEWIETWEQLLLPVLVHPEAVMPAGPAVRLQYVLDRV